MVNNGGCNYIAPADNGKNKHETPVKMIVFFMLFSFLLIKPVNSTTSDKASAFTYSLAMSSQET